MVRQRRLDRRREQAEGRPQELARQVSEGRRPLRLGPSLLLPPRLDIVIGITPEADDVLMTADRRETNRQGTTEVREDRDPEADGHQTVDRI